MRSRLLSRQCVERWIDGVSRWEAGRLALSPELTLEALLVSERSAEFEAQGAEFLVRSSEALFEFEFGDAGHVGSPIEVR